MSTTIPTNHVAWRERKTELADWILRTSVNRIDVWGQYRPMRFREMKKQRDGTEKLENAWTKPAVKKRGQVFLTQAVLECHFTGADVGDICGLHTVSADNTAREIIIDIDKHEGDDADAGTNERAAIAWYDKLVAAGLRVLLEGSNGRGGYHLRLIFDTPLPVHAMHNFGKSIVADWKDKGLTREPEVYPKQDDADGGYGNWVRIIGRHHTLDYWSEIWDGSELWLSDADAINTILDHVPNPTSAMPQEFLTPAPAPKASQQTTKSDRRREADVKRAKKILAELPNENLEYDLWRNICMAAHDTDPTDEMRELCRDWSRKSAKHDDAFFDSCWGYFKSDRKKKFTLGTLVKLARDAGLSCERPLTELGNAQILVTNYGDSFRYCPQTGKLMVFDDNRWGTDHTGQVHRWAKQTARGLWALMTERADIDPKALAKHIVKSESSAGINSMVKLAQTEPGIARNASEFDADPWALNVLNGTIDLRTGKLRPHSRDDLITKLAPVYYDPSAKGPRFASFIRETMGGKEHLERYLARILGMACTGDVSVQELYFWYGSGANGKSVLVDTFLGLLGDYAGLAPPGLLTARTNDEHPTEFMDLMGRRFVPASETEENAHLRIQAVKRLTGDLTIKARAMRQDYIEFPRTHKLVLVTNNRPVIRETTNAIWRRVRLVPFDVTIPPERQDPKLIDKLRAEWPAILAWAVRGCLDWQQNGMQTPTEVLIATQQYQNDSDPLADFIADRCIRGGENVKVTRNELFGDYQSWAKQTGEKFPLERNSFFDRIRRIKNVADAQFRPLGSNTPARGFRGIGLRFLNGIDRVAACNTATTISALDACAHREQPEKGDTDCYSATPAPDFDPDADRVDAEEREAIRLEGAA